jgi:hypothetical protein
VNPKRRPRLLDTPADLRSVLLRRCAMTPRAVSGGAMIQRFLAGMEQILPRIEYCRRHGIDPFEIVADNGMPAWGAVTEHNLRQEKIGG